MIEVFDDVLQKDLFSDLSVNMVRCPYVFGWHSTAADPVNYWNKQHYDKDSLKFSLEIVERVWGVLSPRYPEFTLDRAYSNAMTTGQDGGIHRDSNSAEDLTVLLYTVSRWKADWAGETCFFSEQRDTIKAVLPKPNRMVVFNSNILHVARGLYPHCPDIRTILVFKLLRNKS